MVLIWLFKDSESFSPPEQASLPYERTIDVINPMISEIVVNLFGRMQLPSHSLWYVLMSGFRVRGKSRQLHNMVKHALYRASKTLARRFPLQHSSILPN